MDLVEHFDNQARRLGYDDQADWFNRGELSEWRQVCYPRVSLTFDERLIMEAFEGGDWDTLEARSWVTGNHLTSAASRLYWSAVDKLGWLDA